MSTHESSPLVPQSNPQHARYILATFGLTLTFTAITALIILIKGATHFNHTFIAVGIGLVLLIAPTALLLNTVRTDESLEPRIRYLALFQSLALVFLCITLLALLYEPAPSCPATCDLTGSFRGQCEASGGGGSPCWGGGVAYPLWTHVNTSCPCALIRNATSGQCRL